MKKLIYFIAVIGIFICLFSSCSNEPVAPKFKSEAPKDTAVNKFVSEMIPDTLLEERIKADWQKFYAEEFGLKTDFSKLKLPKNPADFDRVLIIPKGLSYKTILLKITEKFKLSLWENNYDYYDQNVRSVRTNVDKDYAVRVRNRIEADEENKDKSTNDLEKIGANSITLKERLIYELKYFKETGNHLDIDNWTLCAGSRYSDGDVPGAYWNSDDHEFYVGWSWPDCADDLLRSRSAVVSF